MNRAGAGAGANQNKYPGGGSGVVGPGDRGQETPISKYLANLERRKSLFLHPSPQSFASTPSPSVNSPPKTLKTRGPGGVEREINFNDTFFNVHDEDGDQSLLHLSPPSADHHQWMSNLTKKRRLDQLGQNAGGAGGNNWGRDSYEELERKNAELERLLRQTQAELIDGRAAYSKLDQVNIQTRREFQEKIIQYDQAEEEMKIKTKNALERAETLEKQLNKSRSKETEKFRESLSQTQSQNLKLSNLELRVQELEKENFDLKSKIQLNSIDHEKIMKKLSAELEETTKGAETWIMDLQITKDQLSLVQGQLAQAQAELKICQLDSIKLQEIKSKYESVVQESESANNDVLFLQERIKKYENLYLKEQLQVLELKKTLQRVQDENGILRSTIKSEMLLKEQVHSLQSEIQFLQNELKLRSQVQSQVVNLQAELKQWKNVGFQLDSTCTSPSQLENALRSNQQLLLSLKSENSDLSTELQSLRRNVTSLGSEIQDLKRKLAALEAEKLKLAQDYKKLSRRMTLLVQDRDNLMDLKSSYEQEYDGLISEPLKNRVDSLESIVKGLEVLLKETACQTCTIYQKELAQLKEEKTKLSETIVHLNETLASEPTVGIKVVSFGQNPSLLSIEARLQNCLDENTQLKERLRKYEEDTLATLPDEELVREKNRLEEKFRSLEHRHQILTDSYDFETVQLQNAITKLFGFYITLVRGVDGNPNQLRLTSVYSPVPDDYFLFQDGDGGEFVLLETQVLENFHDEINRFLQTENSIPGFLGSVTISYVESATGSGPSTSTLTTAPSNESTRRGPRQIDVVQSEEDDEDDEEENTLQIQSVYSGGINLPRPGHTREIEVEIGGDEDDDDEEEESQEEDEDIYEDLDQDPPDDEEEEDDDDDVVTLD